MRNITHKTSYMASALALVLVLSLVLAACASQPSSNGVQIDWVDFIRFGGITYTTSPVGAGHALNASDLGSVFATVSFKLEGNVQDPGYQSKDGDAAFLNPGTKVYVVKGYNPTFRLAAYQNSTIHLYESDTNPHAKVGADLLDIGGKVLYIGINSDQDGTTELAAVKDSKQISMLVDMILKAPVNQNYQSKGSKRYFIDFHLLDGTSVIRAYWPDSGELSRGILLPPAFATAIKQALR